MKKSILTLTILLTTVFGAQAQQVLTQDIQVSVKVIKKLSITGTQDVELGTILSSENSVLPANSNDSSPVTNAGVGATPGQIILEGADGEVLTVGYSSASLTTASGLRANFIPVVYNGASPVNPNSDVTFTSGNITLDIGGILDSVPAGNEGDYSTTNAGGNPITFTFTYNSI